MKKLTLTLLASFMVSIVAFAQVANQDEITMLVARHNFWRADVGLGTIKYSQQIAKTSNQWAIQLNKKGCKFEHSPKGRKYGENLFKGTIGYYTAADAVDAWGEEKADYNYRTNKCKPGKMCGHYTQIVWKNTTEFGCAKTICEESVTWVCNYNPPGNYVGRKPY